jgi:hypothetical protein
MTTENDPNKKETPAEKPASSAEAKPTETEKSAASSASASDKLNDVASSAKTMAGKVFDKAKGLADEAIKTAKSDTTKENLNNAAKSAGDLASKVFAKAKDAAADVKKELGNVNDLRKETFANADAGTSKKEMAKGFWAKLSGKQKGILIFISLLTVYLLSSILPSSSPPAPTLTSAPVPPSSSSPVPSFSSPSNVTEQAFNPFTGNGQKINEWKDKGGINSQNIFYGLTLTGIGYRTDSAGNFEHMEASVVGTHSPADMRKALSSACGANESSFERINATNNEGRAITSGTYQSSKVWCMHQTAGTANKIYISRRDRDPK